MDVDAVTGGTVFGVIAFFLFYGWLRGWGQTTDFLRQRAVDLLARAEARDAYDRTLEQAKIRWAKEVGLDNGKILEIER